MLEYSGTAADWLYYFASVSDGLWLGQEAWWAAIYGVAQELDTTEVT